MQKLGSNYFNTYNKGYYIFKFWDTSPDDDPILHIEYYLTMDDLVDDYSISICGSDDDIKQDGAETWLKYLFDDFDIYGGWILKVDGSTRSLLTLDQAKQMLGKGE